MHRLEITGETPEALYFNVVKTLSIFAQVPAPAPQETDASSSNGLGNQVQPDNAGWSPVDAEVDFVALAAKSKAKKGKKIVEPGILNDEIGDLGVKTIEHKALTLDDDIRPRLRAIQQAATKRGLDMPATISYIQKLYGPFGIAKAEQLKPEQFAEFMEMSDDYLSGEA